MNFRKLIFATFVWFLIGNDVNAQIPVEGFVGHQKTTADIMFFKFFKNTAGDNSKFLYFNRNRTTIDYRQTSTTYLPIFGFTAALSYNYPKLKGFAPVVVAQVNNQGSYPKAGVQYFHSKNDFTFFSWMICETLDKPNVDFFVLTRYEPKLTENLNLFTQLELVNVFPTVSSGIYNLFQRVRVGLKIKEWQFGAGADFNETGNKTFINTNNIGGFLRHEF